VSVDPASPRQFARPDTIPVGLIRAPRGVRRAPGLLRRMYAFALVELQKLRHDRTELLTRMVQPALWLLIFG
jgi:ABC-2 type transport system permease protein